MVRHTYRGDAYGLMISYFVRMQTRRTMSQTRAVLYLAGLLVALWGIGGSPTGSAPIAPQATIELPDDDPHFRIAAVKYGGGGDWYQAHTPLPEFLSFVHAHTSIDVSAEGDVVEIEQDRLYTYPFLVMSGHGNIELSEREVERLRHYLETGGFLFIDDDYGFDPYVRREMEKVFPEQDFVEIPYDHPIYNHPYDFSDGPPKVHEHDGKPPQGFGLFHEDRLVVYYLYESNITDGWEPPSVHDNPPDVRRTAKEMGVNILTYALTH